MLCTAATLFLVFLAQSVVGRKPTAEFTATITLNGEAVCAGTILDKRFFVTLEDCIEEENLKDYRVIVGEDTVRSISYIKESPEEDDLIIGRFSKTVKISSDDIARVSRIGNEQQVEKARDNTRQSFITGKDQDGNTQIIKLKIEDGDMCGVDSDDDDEYLCLSAKNPDKDVCSMQILQGSSIVSFVNRRWTFVGLLHSTQNVCEGPSKALTTASSYRWMTQVISLLAGSVCSSSDECGENMACVQNRCVCTYCYMPVDGECKQKSNKKILVLGAGMAGISAAKTLHENGCDKFLILEGSDRIGGRVKAADIDGYTVELGAMWLYGLGSNPIAALADEYGLSYVATDDFWTARDINGLNLTVEADEAWENINKALRKVDKYAKEMQRDGISDISIEAMLRNFGWTSDDVVTEAVEVYALDFEYGRESPALSSKHLGYFDAFEEHGSYEWNVVNDQRGYSYLIEEMSKEFLSANDPRLFLNTTVTRIEDWNEDGGKVKVHTADGGYFEADRVIVTFSLGVLQSRQISFVPSLPDKKMKAIDKFGFGDYETLYLKFSTAFWDDTGALLYAGPRHGETSVWLNMNTIIPGCNILQLTYFGYEAMAFDRMANSEIITYATNTLQYMYSGYTEPTHYVRSQWKSDPLTMGAFSYWPTGFTLDDRKDLEASEVNLFFAGDYLSDTSIGYVTSALQSGMKTAQNLIEQI